MGILSSSTSVVRYRVKGELKQPLLETISQGLYKNRIADIDNNPESKTCGWASFKNPYSTDFSGSSFVYDPYIVFCLRMDKKSIPSKVIQKRYMAEVTHRLAKNGQQFISRHEKQEIKDQIVSSLGMRIPATPNMYDVVWLPEKTNLWFFSTLKSANEALETLFLKSFSVSLIRLIPYTQAHDMSDLTDRDLDQIGNLSPTHFAASQ